MLVTKKTLYHIPHSCCHSPGLLQKLSKICSTKLLPTRHLDTLYGSETCEECVEAYHIPGLRKDLEKREKPDVTIVPDPCWQALRRTEYKCRTDPEFNVHWFIDAKKRCLEDPCALDVPRQDLEKYRPSDKLNREYTRTWVECVLKRPKKRVRCTFRPPQIIRRPRQSKLGEDKCSAKANACKIGGAGPECKLKFNVNPKCPTVSMPGCKPVRDPVKCQIVRKPALCRKRLTKYPSFSECLIDPLPDVLPHECNCLKTPSMCSVWEHFRNKKS